MDERFIPYNGSCFLFVFYPEVDWLTAQNACRGIGTQLASIATKEEENFVVNAIRNSLDFSPQALYWVGGELAHNGKFEWVDGTEMKLKGIMSAQIPAVERESEQICLGLQTKASMGAGLHWVSKPCTSIGGYICKRKASLNFETIVQNQTISDSYGRLTSPGYPNQYPVNINYWITISGPDNSRIILQFQKIDIETQEECLYDYIGLNNIDSVLHSYIATSSTFYSQDTNSSSAHDFNGEDTVTSSAEDIDTLANEFKRTSWKQHTTHLDNRRKRYWTPKNHHESESSSQRGDTSNPTIKNSGSYVNNNNNSDRKRTRTTTGNYTVTEFYKVDSLKIRNSSNKLMHGSTSEYDTTFDTSQNYLRLCGAHEASLSKYNFISRTNELYLHFHSDFSITGSGYALTWNAVDTSGCPIQTLTAHEGFINTPNYPHFLLNNLDCTYVIQAPHGKRVLVEFTDFDVVSGAEVKLNIGDELFRPFSQKLQLNDGVYVTRGEKMVIRLQTGEQPRGKGFRAIYKTMNSVVAQKIVDLSNNSYGRLYHLNYPQSFPIDVDYTQHIIAPVGKVILLELHGVSFSKEGCHFGSSIEVLDNYADNNGTWWELCDTSDIGLPLLKDQKTRELQADDDKKVHNHNSPIHIRSYLNSLHIRQKVKGLTGARLNATVFLQEDDKYKVKLLEAEDDSVESCVPNPCLYGGRCITNGEKRKCQCKGHFVGKFCALNVCELDPCIYGQCELTPNKFKCHCQPGYSGVHCDLKQDPCEDNPCENRGECSDNKGTPSPRKKRNNSTPSKKSVVDKKQILQQLVSPATSGRAKVIVSLDELIHLSERMNHLADAGSDPNIKETTFSESNASAPAVTLSRPFSDPKLEKKVTFARLLSKVSHEMNSGSEIDFRNVINLFYLSDMKFYVMTFFLLQQSNPINNSLLSIRTEPPQRANSVPPSPSANDIRSPHSTSSNQGSASLSSSELALADLVYKDIRPKNRPKTTSADSILAMFKNFAVSNAGVNLPSSIIFSPSTTPDETSYIDPGDDDTSTSEAHTPISFSSTAPDSPIFYRQSAIEVPVMDNVSAHKANNSSSNLLCPPTILLEIPNSINKCLSPIRELPTPMPSPAITPIMPRAPSRPKSPNVEETLSVSFSDDDEDGKPNNVKIDIQSIESDQTNDINLFNFQAIPPPPARNRQNQTEFESSFAQSQKPQKPKLNLLQKQIPAIAISVEADFERDVPVPAVRPTNLVIPMLMVQTPSPTMEQKNTPVFNPCPGSPPPQSPTSENNCNHSTTESKNFAFPPSKAQQKKLSQHQSEKNQKSASLDFPFVPPLITITTNIDDTTATESDASSSHTTTSCSKPSIILPSDGRIGSLGVSPSVGAAVGNVPGGMCYLSPFSMCTRGDRAPSESNLSSSGYSSMASPGPSRCGSNNPLFPSEMDDAGTEKTLKKIPGPPGSGMHSSTQSSSSTRRHIHTSILKKPQTQENNPKSAASERDQLYRRSDSETLSDDPLIESNDEGIGTDHLDEKIEEGKIKSAKDLENYISVEMLETGKSLLTAEPVIVETLPLVQLQLPSIVINSESGCDKPLSPVSSRSESPLSDRNAMGKFSSLFFGKADQQLPFTDSDGLYDFPSSDGKGGSATHHRKSTGRRRERKSSRAGLLPSPSKSTSHVQLDLSVVPIISTVQPGSAGSSPTAAFTPAAAHHHHVTKSLSSLNVTRKSPKRRYRCPVASSSSSTESLSSTIKDTMQRSTRGEITKKLVKVHNNVYIFIQALRLLARDQSKKTSRDSDEDIEDATAPLSSLSAQQSSSPSCPASIKTTKLKKIPHSNVKFTKISTNDDDDDDVDVLNDNDEVDPSSENKPIKTIHFANKPQVFHGVTPINSKISRLRAIGHQIRFLRRLEKSIKNRTQFMSVATSDSGPEADDNSDSCLDSPKITSPLLKQGNNGTGGTSSITQGINQKESSHVLTRQKASYRNSVDI
uniref:CSON006260 protein n=1 Tax=Culicoides sonorensis TaxID=179676 RepID=A0A336N481_CULSO